MKLELSEPAPCCATGLCGPEPGQQLIGLQNLLFLFEKWGLSVNRYALDPAVKQQLADVTLAVGLQGFVLEGFQSSNCC